MVNTPEATARPANTWGNHSNHMFQLEDYIDPNNDQTSNLNIPNTAYIEVDHLKDIRDNTNHKYNCLHLNIQSLPSKFDLLKQLLSLLKEDRVHIDFIMLCETFLTDSNSHLYNIPGYNLVCQNRTKSTRGGVALYVSTDYHYKLRPDLAINVEGEFESIFIEIRPKQSNDVVIVGEIYRIPNTNINESLQRYEHIINKLSQYKQVYIGTDQNIDYLKVSTHRATADLLDCFLAGGLVPLINRPTRITHSSATLIDNIYTKMTPHQQVKSFILHYDISDHLPILSLTGHKDIKNKEPLTFTYRPLTDDSVSAILNELYDFDWDMLDNFNNIDESYNTFSNIFNTIIDKHAPIKTKTIAPSQVIREPWFSKGLLKSSKHLHKLYSKSLGNDNINIITQYKQYRNLFNSLKRTAKQEYYKREFEKYKNNSKKTWQVINSMLNKANNKQSVLDYFMDDPVQVANNFCQFFTDVGPNLAQNIPVGKNNPEYFLKGNYSHSIYLAPTDEQEILRAIGRLKSSASCGHDNVSAILTKKLSLGLAAPLAHLINMSIHYGEVPTALKIAKVIPIHKKDDKDIIGNYRPISLLPIFSKIFEKIMHKRLYSYIISKSILYKSQYGFRQGHSTIQAVSELVENIISGLDNQESTLAVFLDLSKAFDTIDHNILLKKLEFYGIRGRALEWFSSYLHDRKQYVSIDGHDSIKYPIKCGVPQGSVLGPLLFIIYTNDLPVNFRYSKSILFADDTNIFKSSKNLSELFNQVNSDLQMVTEWFFSNRLSLNSDKTHYILFTLSKANTSNFHISLNGNIIERKKYVKFLGIYVDDRLTWNNHIDYVKNRLSSALYGIRSVKHIASLSSLLTLYYSFFYPHINYGLILWGAASQTSINKIVVLQKKVLRLITKSSYNAHTAPLFNKLRIMKLNDLYEFHLGKFVYGLYNNLNPEPLQDFFITNNEIHEYNTRNQKNPHTRLHKTMVTARSIFSKSYMIWKNVNPEIRNSVSIHSFTSKYKKSIITKYKAM